MADANPAPGGSVPSTKRARGTQPVTPPRAGASTAGAAVTKRARGGSGAGASGDVVAHATSGDAEAGDDYWRGIDVVLSDDGDGCEE